MVDEQAAVSTNEVTTREPVIAGEDKKYGAVEAAFLQPNWVVNQHDRYPDQRGAYEEP